MVTGLMQIQIKKMSIMCIFICTLVFLGAFNVNGTGMMPPILQPAVNPEFSYYNSGELQYVTITVFNHVLANEDHHAIVNITLPSDKRVVSCRMEITEHLDSDEPWWRATAFYFDNIDRDAMKYMIGTSRVNPYNVKGNIIGPGQTKTYSYNMSNVQFANRPPKTGSWYWNFIPQKENDTFGYLSPGSHVIEAWITSYDRFSGKLPADTWITLKLYFVFEDLLGKIIDDLIDNIESSSAVSWREPSTNRKQTMIDKLIAVKDLVGTHNFEEAYDILLHDIKPKLTGLKTDENEEPWGNDIFNNPWVTCCDLQEAYRLTCNEILTRITRCLTGI
jgi:hypothetical protein